MRGILNVPSQAQMLDKGVAVAGEINMRSLVAAAVLTVMLGLAHAGAAWAWGAIAVDHDYGEDPEDSGYVLVAQHHATRAAAAADALTTCQDNGDNCEVVLTFQKCGAYAASKTRFGVGVATTLKRAEQRAVAACGRGDCQVVVSDCE
jgi:hypothetical protein